MIAARLAFGTRRETLCKDNQYNSDNKLRIGKTETLQISNYVDALNSKSSNLYFNLRM